MAMDIPKLRKLVSLDESDPLSRFALGKKLFEEASGEKTPTDETMLIEAVDHLRFANVKAPEHLATYHILAQALIRLKRGEEARPILEEGIRRVAEIGEGMGRDLGPAMRELLNNP